jgi:hypothetical protein
MIRTVTNDSINSRIDFQIGRAGATLRVDAIHIHHRGPEDAGEVIVDIKREDGQPMRLILQPGAARQLADWINDQAC